MQNKQIFSLEENTSQPESETNFETKQEFQDGEYQLDTDTVEMVSAQLQEKQAPTTHSSYTSKILRASLLLFVLALFAQSLQWIWDSYQQQQWLYLVFAILSLIFITIGGNALLQEWRKLRRLKHHLIQQQQAEIWLQQQDFSVENQQKSQQFCLEIARNLQDIQALSGFEHWKNQQKENYSVAEAMQLFNMQVLTPLDEKAQKLITQQATEAAIFVAISPLALVDMFFIAWRNISLINKIAKLYGMELGYYSRLRLLRLVLVNMAFAGVTELIQDIGIDWLSQDLTVKLSSRVAQGLGVGLITARLGLKAMQFCRPIPLQQEKPRLSHIQKALLTSLKSKILGNEEHKQHSESVNKN